MWAPPDCRVRIEYSTEILGEARHNNGFLYGTEEHGSFRVIAAGSEPPAPDVPVGHLKQLGTFTFRERGEVFMTESDLVRLELSGGSIALVTVGAKAGFFVYEPDGSIQTVKSHLEFPVPQERPRTRPARAPSPAWLRPALVGALAFASMLLPVRGAQPLALTLREDSGQLKITWNTGAFDDARLEITDGAERNWIPIPRGLASATYVPATSDVRVRLIDNGRVKDAHFVRVLREEADIVALQEQAESLRASVEESRQRAATLERKLATLK